MLQKQAVKPELLELLEELLLVNKFTWRQVKERIFHEVKAI